MDGVRGESLGSCVVLRIMGIDSECFDTYPQHLHSQFWRLRVSSADAIVEPIFPRHPILPGGPRLWSHPSHAAIPSHHNLWYPVQCLGRIPGRYCRHTVHHLYRYLVHGVSHLAVLVAISREGLTK